MYFFSQLKWVCSSLLLNLLILNLAEAKSALFSSKSTAWDLPNACHPKGKLVLQQFTSNLLGNKRDIWIYTPASYTWIEGPYPLLIVFDGQAYVSELISGPTQLDNLIAEKKIPPLVAVFVSSIDQKTRNCELPCSSRFSASMKQELLPWISRRYFVSQNPSDVILAGSSYGGLAAAFAALSFPSHFGNVLSQSGALWWNPASDNKEPYLIQLYEKYPRVSVRFYLDVGDKETDSAEGELSMVKLNRYLYHILNEKGYEVAYHEFHGGHEYECWRQTFARGLINLIGKKAEYTETRHK